MRISILIDPKDLNLGFSWKNANIAQRLHKGMKENIRRVRTEDIKKFLIDAGEKPFRVKQIEQWLWEKHIKSFDEMLNLSKNLREKLQEHYVLERANPKTTNTANDGTAKVGFQLVDGAMVEGVYIPSGNRVTACVSSQTGCKLNCSFCATAQIKSCKNMYADEIFDQVVEVKRMAEEQGNQLTNIVYMGMGEPLLNYEEVMLSIQFITGTPGLAMSPSRITLSTAGIIPGIEKMTNDEVKFNLAISLHSAVPEIRDKLMPINKKYPLHELSDAIVKFHEKTGNRVTLEYLMLKGVNDSLADARALAEYTKAFPVKINLIEYNPVDEYDYQPSGEDVMQQFVNVLEHRNMIINIRRSRGKEIDAACGQLANKHTKK